jgi:signal transduction histidine kinase/CheY-like chemotaxis protein
MTAADLENRVLVFAPLGRDAELTRHLLERASIACVVCGSLGALIEMFAIGDGGSLLLTEEALDHRDFFQLVAALEQQPAWSDIPVLLLAGGSGSEMTARAIRSIETLRNVTLLERPIRLAVVLTAVRAAVRSRARQYEVRDLLMALQRARTEAEHASRLKDEFLATLSHELRTPLNAILGWTSMLVRGQVEPRRLARVYEVLDRNAQSQAQLIGDVLDVSRIITGKLQLQLAAVNLEDVIARAIDAVRPAASARNIAVQVGDASPGLVYGDPDRLQQIFWNLLSNAIKFTPVGGTISVEATRGDGTVLVSVVDSGVGISADFVPFVFDRFRQADQTTTRSHGGLGLGLSIVRHLAELHGGTVSASSDGIGQGARFDVLLPALDQAGIVIEPPRIESASASLEGVSVLIVDDDESTREVVTAALESAHAQVRAAASAVEARALLASHRPTLIIADLGMPVEDGFSFIRSARESAARDVPAVALSAYADATTRGRALAAGFTAFLAKPTRVHTLLELARTLIDASRPVEAP